MHCIFTTFDDSYFPYAKACINSLHANYPDHPQIIIYYPGNKHEVREYVERMPNVSLLDLEFDLDKIANLNLGVIGSSMIFIRLFLWTNLFDQYETIVYLDCDTIVVKPFAEVFEKNSFFCVADSSPDPVFRQEVSADPDLLRALYLDGMDLTTVNSTMINSGFFVLPKKYRSAENVKQIWRIADTYNNFIMHSDQSILSIWCQLNNITASRDYQYNFQTYFILSDIIHKTDLDDIKIMHFSFWKPDKTFNEVLKPAQYVMRAWEQYLKYSSADFKSSMQE